MPNSHANSTMAARQLAKELRRLREASEMRQEDVARYVGCPKTTISKFETTERFVPEPHLRLMLLCYGVDEEHAAPLYQLAREAREPGWWRDDRFTVPEWFEEYVGLESAATAVWSYESEYVPGLLQTQRYIESISAANGSPNNAEGAAAVRATRQERLRGDNQLKLRTIINEAVLWRPVGSPDVMREQLQFLRDSAQQSNIALRLLPFAAGAHPGMTGPFTILRFPETTMDVVYIELRGDAEYRNREHVVQHYTDIFERIWQLALTERDTGSLLNQMIERY